MFFRSTKDAETRFLNDANMEVFSQKLIKYTNQILPARYFESEDPANRQFKGEAYIFIFYLTTMTLPSKLRIDSNKFLVKLAPHVVNTVQSKIRASIPHTVPRNFVGMRCQFYHAEVQLLTRRKELPYQLIYTLYRHPLSIPDEIDTYSKNDFRADEDYYYDCMTNLLFPAMEKIPEDLPRLAEQTF